MQAEAKERWYNALESPLEGVEFTYEEFADALSKYDFSFEIGDAVSTPDMLSYMSFYQSTMLDSGVEFLIEF
jgi:small subunit ribosomal protein S1